MIYEKQGRVKKNRRSGTQWDKGLSVKLGQVSFQDILIEGKDL